MTKFLLAVRKAYDTKRIAFVIAFCAVFIFLYFAPNCLCPNGVGYLGLFGDWLWVRAALSASSAAAAMASRIIGTILFAVAIVCTIVSLKRTFFLSGVLPFCICAIAMSIVYMPYCWLTEWKVYSAFYIIVCLLVILAVVLILLATYLPLKEPAPAEPKPERKRKPSKAERIAELERQVAELTKEKDAE